jgi:hypothetical protein
MRLIVLFLVLVISIPPLQAGYCDMETGQAASHQMHHGNGGGHKCCDPEQPESQHGCGGDMLCGFCSANVSTLLIVYNVHLVPVQMHIRNFSSGAIAPPHSSPLYRPPIS